MFAVVCYMYTYILLLPLCTYMSVYVPNTHPPSSTFVYLSCCNFFVDRLLTEEELHLDQPQWARACECKICKCSTLFTSFYSTLTSAATVTDGLNLSEVEEDVLVIMPSALSRIEEIGDGKHSFCLTVYARANYPHIFMFFTWNIHSLESI